jgi:hypothetical protein
MAPQSVAVHEGVDQMTPPPIESQETVAVRVALVPDGTGFGEIVAATEIGMTWITALTDFVLS